MSEPSPYQQRIPRGLIVLLAVLVATGTAAFLYAVTRGAHLWKLRGWEDYLINWFFWSSMAQGGIVVAAILEVTDSKWGRPMKRLAECCGAFLPVSFILYLLFYPGMVHIYPWATSPSPGLGGWLSQNFVFARDGAALLLLYGVSLVFVYYSVRPDLGGKADEGGRGAALRRWLKRGWRGDDQEIAIGRARRKRLAVAVLMIYAGVYSILGYDLLMSIVPTWYSTLFGAYMFIMGAFGALAMVAVMTVLLGGITGVSAELGEPQYHDLGKLLFGFTLLALDFFWSQFLVMWYGNIPEETDFMVLRAYGHPWMAVTWVVLFGTFVLPFVLLLRRGVKAQPKKLMLAALWIVIMIWFEKFLLVAPSAWSGTQLPLGPLELIVTAGFGGLYLLSFFWLIGLVPPLPVSDPIFTGGELRHHVLGEPDVL